MFPTMLEVISFTYTRQELREKPCTATPLQQLTHAAAAEGREQGTGLVSDTTGLQPHSANRQSPTRRARAQEVLTSLLHLLLLPSQQVTPFQATVGAKNCPAGRSRLKQVSRMLLFIRKKIVKLRY